MFAGKNEWHNKKASRADLIQKKKKKTPWGGVLKIDAFAAAKHKSFYHGLNCIKKLMLHVLILFF